jgi:hypothetical protein
MIPAPSPPQERAVRHMPRLRLLATVVALPLAAAGCVYPNGYGYGGYGYRPPYYGGYGGYGYRPPYYGGYGGYGGYGYRPAPQYLPPVAAPFTGPFFGYGQGYAPPPGVRW